MRKAAYSGEHKLEKESRVIISADYSVSATSDVCTIVPECKFARRPKSRCFEKREFELKSLLRAILLHLFMTKHIAGSDSAIRTK
ncbi:uncharacterized protein PHALS_13440 [Plasmopara halstedii]|uniref:Uncharacterized protein n=1 Tax=Plasmopara halstedii TaxID=4781 RepID=A0A0P1APK6_PLAHL|nr:uncharacterized protein PHALS_13440 [Plasmopara halstedii]CEG43228.1 hypothetical protein PHALS_13440 [Plasmopara halstedii]|eukprot:XP_024579597.1 hypothetical protein PHALS_13440 [Plasmopara halstedii]